MVTCVASSFPLHIEDLTCARQVVLLTGANAVVHEVVARSFWEVRDSKMARDGNQSRLMARDIFLGDEDPELQGHHAGN